jgi:predicted nucleic acid-binding protein
MRMKRGVGETFTLVLAKEFRITKLYMVDLVARALAIQLLPLFIARAALSLLKKSFFFITS